MYNLTDLTEFVLERFQKIKFRVFIFYLDSFRIIVFLICIVKRKHKICLSINFKITDNFLLIKNLKSHTLQLRFIKSLNLISKL